MLVLALVACGSYHPDGYADPTVHGLEAKLGAGHDAQGGDCRDCHGADLEGGDGPACSECHPAGWTTTCTFCHGDVADGTGSPPRDLDGTTVPEDLSFPPHRAHVDEGRFHADLDCSTCHTKPDSALAPGHVFDDDTPGEADVVLDGGGTWDPDARTCRVACHGDGTGHKGTVSADGKAATCHSCHEAEPSTGQHVRHHQLEGFACSECHPDVGDDGKSITGLARHVDGKVDLSLPSGIAFDRPSGTCTGSCHGETHNGRVW